MQRHEVCILLDKLSLEVLKLMEDRVKCQVNIENATNSGSLNLAKSRYIMGQNTVSSVQLPTENSLDFSALATVEKNNTEDGLQKENFELVTKPSEPNTTFVNPVRWFGVLVPQNLYEARNIFQNVLNYIIESVNIQRQINDACNAMLQLKKIKTHLSPEE